MENTSYPIKKTLKRLLDNLVDQDKSIILYFIIFTIAAAYILFFQSSFLDFFLMS